MGAKPLGRPDGRKKVSNLTRRKERQRARDEQNRARSEFIKAEAKARGRGLTRLEAQRLVERRAPSAALGEKGATTFRKLSPSNAPKETATITTTSQQKLAPPKVSPTEVRRQNGGKLVDQIFPVQTKIITRNGQQQVVRERGIDVVSLPTKGVRFVLEKGTEIEDSTRRALGRPESRKININPRDVVLFAGFTPAFSSTGFTQSFQPKVVPNPAPKPVTTQRTTQFRSGGLTRDVTVTSSRTSARTGTVTTDIGQALGFKPIGTTQIAPARTSISSVNTVTTGGKTVGTGFTQTTTGSRTFNQAFNIRGTSTRITPNTPLNSAQARALKQGLLETQKGSVIRSGTQFNQFTAQITKVSPTPTAGKSTTTITGTGANLNLNQNTFLTKTGSVDISKQTVRGTNLQTTKGVTRVVDVPSTSRVGTTFSGGGRLGRAFTSVRTSALTQSVGRAILPKTAPRNFVTASVAPPVNTSGIIGAITSRLKPRQRQVQTQVIASSPQQRLGAVNVVDFTRPAPTIPRPPIVRTGGRSSSTTRTPTTTLIVPRITTDPTPPTGGGIPPGVPRIPRPPRTPRVPPIGLPLTPSFTTGIPRRSFGARKRRFADVPSFAALAFGIRGSGGTRGISGLGFKPVSAGFSFENVFNQKKKKRRKK